MSNKNQMLKETYYIVTHSYPTNRPGEWSEKKVFQSKNAAESYLKSLLDKDSVKLPKTEWDDGGPNWEILESWEFDDEIMTLEVIKNN